MQTQKASRRAWHGISTSPKETTLKLGDVWEHWYLALGEGLTTGRKVAPTGVCRVASV